MKFVLYVDVNNAFLSWSGVELLKNGEEDIRKIPAVIGGDEEKRHGVVLARSELSKKIGIKSGEPLYQAKKKYPYLKIVKPNYSKYREYSDKLYEFLKRYSNTVIRYSIDECMVDITKLVNTKESAFNIAKEIQEKVLKKFGFTINIGISSNRILSKMASDLEKPNKINTLYIEEIEQKMWGLPINDLIMCGRKTTEKLNQLHIQTIGDLAKFDELILEKKIGKLGILLKKYANGIDDEEYKINYDAKSKSISYDKTLARDLKEESEILIEFSEIVEKVAYKLRKDNAKAKVIAVKIRTFDFIDHTHQKKLFEPTSSTKIIFDEVKKLYISIKNIRPLRLLGVRIEKANEEENEQISFFENKENKRLEKIDETVDKLKEKFGFELIKRGIEINANRKNRRT